jgi:excisionase family DNA binding protein
MRSELDEEDIAKIAARVAEHIKPLLNATVKEADTILDVDEACRLLKISRQSLYQLVDSAKYGKNSFPYLKCGRLLRFSENDILTWLKSK